MNDAFDFGFDFNRVVFTGKEIIICNIDDAENYINELVIKTSEIIEISEIVCIKDNGVVERDDYTHELRKYHITMNNGVKFLIATNFIVD